MDDVTRHKDFLSYGDWRVLSWNFLKNVKGKRKKSFSHIRFYTCSILQMVHRSSSFSIGKIKKDPLVSLPSIYRKSTRESSIFCTIRTVESSNRRIVTNWQEYRCIDDINFHAKEIWWKKEIIKKKREGGKRADARNTFSSLRIKKKDDRRRDGDYTSSEGSTVLLSNSFSFLSAIDVNYTLHSLVLRCTPAIIALRFCSAIRKTITRNRVREGDRKGTV